ncbi:MAG: helix-turn-helix domain-containing protein [Proteobacteria bacterium]|nr:helix-turn-helix domain-containing protein [Pseudomonadota bacterium]
MDKKTINLIEELGSRLKQTRINASLTQSQLGDIIGKSRTAVERAEKGKCNLNTFVSILVALDADGQLALLLPEPPPSPVLLAKAKGKQRKRASARKLEESHEVGHP